MSSITIHNMDDLLAARLKERASEEGESLNSMVKDLLRDALGIEPSASANSQQGYRRFLGKWGDKELRDFQKATADFSRIDEEDWKG